MLSFTSSLSPNSEAFAIFVTEKYDYKDKKDILPNNVFRRRLAFDELLSHQLAIAIIRNYNQKQKGIEFKSSSLLVDNFIDFDKFGKKINISQKGKTPKLAHMYMASNVK